MVDWNSGAPPGYAAHLCVPLLGHGAVGLGGEALLEAEEIDECFPEISHEPVDGEIQGSIDDL